MENQEMENSTSQSESENISENISEEKKIIIKDGKLISDGDSDTSDEIFDDNNDDDDVFRTSLAMVSENSGGIGAPSVEPNKPINIDDVDINDLLGEPTPFVIEDTSFDSEEDLIRMPCFEKFETKFSDDDAWSTTTSSTRSSLFPLEQESKKGYFSDAIISDLIKQRSSKRKIGHNAAVKIDHKRYRSLSPIPYIENNNEKIILAGEEEKKNPNSKISAAAPAQKLDSIEEKFLEPFCRECRPILEKNIIYGCLVVVGDNNDHNNDNDADDEGGEETPSMESESSSSSDDEEDEEAGMLHGFVSDFMERYPWIVTIMEYIDCLPTIPHARTILFNVALVVAVVQCGQRFANFWADNSDVIDEVDQI